MGAIVGSLLSVSLKAVYDKLTSPEVVNYFKRKNNDLLLTKLKMLLNSANAALIDADEKQITNSAVKKWLHDLKDAVYVADDLLDDIGTEALVAKFSDDNEVRKFLSNTFNSFDNRIKSDLKKIVERLENAMKEKDVLGLKAFAGELPPRQLTTACPEEYGVYGRDIDKQEIFKKLVSDGKVSGDGISVIPIVAWLGLVKQPLLDLYIMTTELRKFLISKHGLCL